MKNDHSLKLSDGVLMIYLLNLIKNRKEGFSVTLGA